MAKDTLTLYLNGEISLNDFAKAISEFNRLVKSLQNELDKKSNIEWSVEGLGTGSATATVRGFGKKDEDMSIVESVTKSYEDVGKSLQCGQEIKHSKEVRDAAMSIAGLINGKIKSVTFITDDYDAEVIEKPAMLLGIKEDLILEPSSEIIRNVSYGAIRGRVQTITDRNELKFTLYDVIDDHPIFCFFEPGRESLMRNTWGKVAIVEGLIRRNPITRQPITIRKIKQVKVLAEKGGYRDAIGCAPRKRFDKSTPEDAIRRIRDAE